MMAACRARRCGLVGLSAESAERSTTHLLQIFDVTWLLCHPDLPGLRIYDPVPGAPTGLGSTLRDGVCRYRLGQLLTSGRVDYSTAIGHVSGYLGPAAVQSGDLLWWLKVGPIAPGPTVGIRYGRLLGATGRTTAQLGPAAAQSAPALSLKVAFAGVTLPGYQHPDNNSTK